jgi:hypothetical protein
MAVGYTTSNKGNAIQQHLSEDEKQQDCHHTIIRRQVTYNGQDSKLLASANRYTRMEL